jgi:prevent-host-death family protein
MKTIGAFKAKTHLSELLRAAERGESFLIVRRNKAVARLMSLKAAPDPESIQQMVERIRSLRHSIHASRLEINQWIREGQR